MGKSLQVVLNLNPEVKIFVDYSEDSNPPGIGNTTHVVVVVVVVVFHGIAWLI